MDTPKLPISPGYQDLREAKDRDLNRYDTSEDCDFDPADMPNDNAEEDPEEPEEL